MEPVLRVLVWVMRAEGPVTRKGGEGRALQRWVPLIYIDIQVLEWILVSIPAPTPRARDRNLAIISTFQKSRTGFVPRAPAGPFCPLQPD